MKQKKMLKKENIITSNEFIELKKYTDVIARSNYFLELLIKQNQLQEEKITEIKKENEQLKEMLSKSNLLLESNTYALEYLQKTVQSLNNNIERSEKTYINLNRRYESLANSKLGKVMLLYRNIQSERKKK